MNFSIRKPSNVHRFFSGNSELKNALSMRLAQRGSHVTEKGRGAGRPGTVKVAYLYLIIILSAFACGSAPVKEINSDINKNKINLNIRYVNISSIFDYMINRDPDAAALKKRRDELLASIEDIRKELENTEGDEDKGLLGDLRGKQGALLKLKSDEDYYKSRILNEIDGAIEVIAKRDDIDFVFNMGEGAVYARKEYDITERILREIESRVKRNSPVSR